MVQARTVTDLREIDEMTPPACLLWQLAIQICLIQITRIILITNITINTITGATPITILDMTAVIAGAGIAGTAAGEIPVAEMLVAVADVIRALLYNKRKRASLIFFQECPFYVYSPFNTSRIFACV
jgi:hypothetical protein